MTVTDGVKQLYWRLVVSGGIVVLVGVWAYREGVLNWGMSAFLAYGLLYMVIVALRKSVWNVNKHPYSSIFTDGRVAFLVTLMSLLIALLEIGFPAQQILALTLFLLAGVLVGLVVLECLHVWATKR